MNNVVALVLAGGNMGDYGVLTQNRAKGALTFAGLYRIIDFALSNLVNAGVNQIGLIIQYLPGSLIEHVGSGQPWDLDNYGKNLKILPPFVGVARTIWYNGTADAIYQNMNFVRDQKAEHVIVLSGEHVFNVDFQDVLQHHIHLDADLTVVTKQLPPEKQKRRYGYVLVDDDGRITKYSEKPAVSPSDIAATGIYVFKAHVLSELLARDPGSGEKNLAKDILQPYADKVRSFEYRLDGCWEYLETVQDYYDIHYTLMASNNFALLRQWNIMTNLKFRRVGHAPASGFGKEASVHASMISPGCNIQGTVTNSILSPGVKVARGAVVNNSILLHDCHVGEGVMLDHVISDRDAQFGDGALVGQLDDEPAEAGIRHPLTLVGKGCVLGEGIVIPPGTQIRPGKHLATQEAANMEI